MIGVQVAPTPACSTASSQASSLSPHSARRRARPGIPPEQRARRLGERWRSQSWRTTCASSCASTVRMRSSLQPSPHAGITTRGRRHPHVASSGLRRDAAPAGGAPRHGRRHRRLAPAHILRHHCLRHQAAEAHAATSSQPSERAAPALRASARVVQLMPAVTANRVRDAGRGAAQPSRPSASRPSSSTPLVRQSPPGARRRGQSAQTRRA